MVTNMKSERIYQLEDDFLRILNVLAGLGADTKYNRARYMSKTPITAAVFDNMVEIAKSVSAEIVREKIEKDNGGLNENWPFDVINAYFTHKQ